MMLGKQRSGRSSATASRQQQQQQQHRHMRRTTSMTEFAAPEDVLVDVAEEEEEDEAEELQLLPAHAEAAAEPEADLYGWSIIGGASAAGRADDWLATTYRARAAPKKLAGLRRNSADFSAAETAAFLRACGLCNRRLGPGRDTFMYRGDTAFCSLECRQQHITIEEWKDKCALATPPTAAPASDLVVPLPPSGSGSDKPGTLTAAS